MDTYIEGYIFDICIITLYTLSLHNFICQFHLNKAGKEKEDVVILQSRNDSDGY